jgi:hypothetical protein
MQLNWQKCQGEVWCKLNFVNLEHSLFNNLEGIYVIWHGGEKPATVFVGKGAIREKITQHRSDERIQKPYAELGLFATWAPVPPESRAGIEAFLIDKLTPIIRDQIAPAEPIPINLPW